MKPSTHSNLCSRSFFLDLARQGGRAPVATDLLLHEHPDAAEILHDGPRLGRLLAQAAQRYRTPLAFPIMDLMLEKAFLLQALGIAADKVDQHHLESCPTPLEQARLRQALARGLSPRMRAHCQALSYIAEQTPLVPIGMCIGPFSLTSKLIQDPITPVYLAGAGARAADEPELAILEGALELAMHVIQAYAREQIRCGAKAFFIAEPAANQVFFSPTQLAQGADIFERYVLRPNRQLRDLLAQEGVQLFFHCCGELTDAMVEQFGALHPTILSLGSSRQLWQDARLVPKDVVLYGNLPSKRFYSDELISQGQVQEQSRQLLARMRDAQHPFILGSECDVLSVPGAQQCIANKVQAMLTCPCS